MAQTAALPVLSGETGLTRYLEEIRRFPMLEPQEEFMLAKRWREHEDREAAHRLVTSHLRLVAKIAMGYRGYGLPISEVISEGNVGLMQAVKRFEPDKGFRLATYAMWWIKAAIQEYILRSWSLVKMGTTANQKKLFFNLRKAKSRISALEEGDMRPDQVKLIAKRLGVTEQDVIDMNRRLGGDASLNAPIREDGDSGEWMDWLVDDSVSQESRLAESEQSDNRHQALGAALGVLNDRERRIFEARRLADEPITLEELADEFGVSRERVRQIEVRAFEKVQKAVKNTIAAMETPAMAQAAVAACALTGIKLGERGFGAAFENDRALAAGDVARGRKGSVRLILVGAVERQQAFATQAINFRQIKADTRLIDRRDSAIEIDHAVRRPAGRQHNLGCQAHVILRDWSCRCRLLHFSVNHARRVRDTGPVCSCPCQQQPAAAAPRRQTKFFRQSVQTARDRERAFAVANEVTAHADVVQRMADAVRLIEGLGERNSALDAAVRSGLIACQQQHVGAANMRANARIVPAEGMAKMPVPAHVIA